jgi:hypothetical protein
MQTANPDYISQEKFDRALQEFQQRPNNDAVFHQAVTLIQLLRGSTAYKQVLFDVAQAAKTSGHTSKEQTSEIAFAMGMQFGFDLASNYPQPRT